MYILLFPGGSDEAALFHLPAQAHRKHMHFKLYVSWTPGSLNTVFDHKINDS